MTIEERLSRFFDGDLGRSDRLELLAELAAHPEYLQHVSEQVEIERQLAVLAGHYDVQAVPPAPRGEPRRRSLATVVGAPFSLLAKGWLSVCEFAGLRAAMAVNMAAVSALCAAVLLMNYWIDHVSPRFQVVELRFQVPSDTVDWTDEFQLAPGQRLQLRVQADSEQSIHLHLQSEQEPQVVLTHERWGRHDFVHVVTRAGSHYATMTSPAEGDLLTVHNQGVQSVQLHLQTQVPGLVGTALADGARATGAKLSRPVGANAVPDKQARPRSGKHPG